uniref:TIL domain-containing protein n=1 Tax=Anopheles stephensi TaxID=30069 RepID=A0A182XWY9_ANOST
MKLLLALFAVLLLASCLEASRCIPKRCPRNERFTCCVPCTQKYCSEQDINCPDVCRPGCVCRNGFVRENQFGNCVRPKLCPK